MDELPASEHEIFTYVGEKELKDLLEVLSERLESFLALVDGETGKIIEDTGVDSEWLVLHWLSLKEQLTGHPKLIAYDNYSLLGSLLHVAGMELVLLAGSFAPAPPLPDIHDFETVQHILGQYLRGQVSAYYERDFVTMLQKVQLPTRQLTRGDYYQRIVELAAAVPGVTMTGVRVLTPAGTGKQVAAIGGCLQEMPLELPVAGVWGKSLKDGQMYLLDNLAEDPGIPAQLAERLAAYSGVYLPLGWGSQMVAVLLMVFAKRIRLYCSHTRELLTCVKRWGSILAMLAHYNEGLLWVKRQLRGQTHLLDSLAAWNIESLADIEEVISVLWGLSWVQISFDAAEVLEHSAQELLGIPLRHADGVFAYLYAPRRELEALGQEVLDLGIDFLSHFVKLWRELAGRSQPEGRLNLQLTPRELQVAQLIAQGESNKTAAAKLNLSERTVKTHVSNILRKLNLPDRTAIAVWYIKHQPNMA